jgi:hypothetical protein
MFIIPAKREAAQDSEDEELNTTQKKRKRIIAMVDSDDENSDVANRMDTSNSSVKTPKAKVFYYSALIENTISIIFSLPASTSRLRIQEIRERLSSFFQKS